jgi:hypothetical protein
VVAFSKPDGSCALGNTDWALQHTERLGIDRILLLCRGMDLNPGTGSTASLNCQAGLRFYTTVFQILISVGGSTIEYLTFATRIFKQYYVLIQ